MKKSTFLTILLLICALLIGLVVWRIVDQKRMEEHSILSGSMRLSRNQIVEYRNGDTTERLVFNHHTHWQTLFEDRQPKTGGESIDPESWVYRITYQTLDNKEIVCLVCPDGIVIGDKTFVFKNSDGSIADHVKIVADMYENFRDNAVA